MAFDLRNLLDSPWLYQQFQQTFGFFNARVYAVTEHLDIRPGMKIIDIGCGPGFIVEHLPSGVEYHGFDTDQAYIDYANQRFGDRGRFYRRIFDDTAAAEFAGADLVMMNGVLHHMDDETVRTTLTSAHGVLKPRGQFFALDGCYREGQSPIARRLLDNDRGRHVRTESAYAALLAAAFPRVETTVKERLSRVPYTFVFSEGWRQ